MFTWLMAGFICVNLTSILRELQREQSMIVNYVAFMYVKNVLLNGMHHNKQTESLLLNDYFYWSSKNTSKYSKDKKVTYLNKNVHLREPNKHTTCCISKNTLSCTWDGVPSDMWWGPTPPHMGCKQTDWKYYVPVTIPIETIKTTWDNVITPSPCPPIQALNGVPPDMGWGPTPLTWDVSRLTESNPPNPYVEWGTPPSSNKNIFTLNTNWEEELKMNKLVPSFWTYKRYGKIDNKFFWESRRLFA